MTNTLSHHHTNKSQVPLEAYLNRVNSLLELAQAEAAQEELRRCQTLIYEHPQENFDPELLTRLDNFQFACEALHRSRKKRDILAAKAVDERDPLQLLSIFELQRLEEYLRAASKDSVQLIPTPGANIALDEDENQHENSAQGAHSQFGGRPWGLGLEQIPRGKNGNLLPLLLQINLSNLSEGKIMPALPQQGMLYFFLDPTAGFPPSPETGSWQVVYTDPATNLRADGQLPAAAEHWPRQLIDLHANPSLPSPLSPLMANLAGKISRADLDRYLNLHKRYYPQFDHHLLGYPAYVEPASLAQQCKILAQGLETRQANGAEQVQTKSPSTDKGRNQQQDWRLLAQIDWNPPCSMWWGNYGRLFFMITDQDLAALRFDRVLLLWQHHNTMISMVPEMFGNLGLCLETRDSLWRGEIYEPFRKQFLG